MAQAAGLLDESLTGLSLQQFFAMHASQAMLARQSDDVDQITQEVAKHSVERRLGPGHRLFSFGEAPDSFYLILKVRKCHIAVRFPCCRVLKLTGGVLFSTCVLGLRTQQLCYKVVP